MKDKKNFVFVDMRVPVFVNKANGQMSITLPKRKMKRFIKDNPNPTEVKISLWKPVK